MEIRGTVVEVANNVTIKGQSKNFTGTKFTYRDADGSLKEQNFHENALKYNKDLAASLASLKAGDAFTMVKEKEGEFWNVKSIVAGSVPTQAAKTAQPYADKAAASSTYSTTEERAQTQVYIVRQSSIANALKLLEVRGDKKAVPADVIAIATMFESWVLGKLDAGELDQDSPEDMEDDVNF